MVWQTTDTLATEEDDERDDVQFSERLLMTPNGSPPWSRNLRSRASATGRSVFAALMLTACGSPEDTSAPEPATALTVELVAPSRQEWPLRIGASGEVAAWQESSIGAEIGGVRLDQLLVNVGDVVRKGQVLAHFNEEHLRAELAQREAAAAEALARADKARSDMVRTERLDAAEVLSKQSVQDVRTQLAIAEAQLASAKALQAAASLKLRNARVLAPDDGVISSRTGTVGSVVSVGTELFRLIRGHRLEWRARVRADALPRLQIGMPVVIRRLDASTISGTLRQIAPVVNSDTGSALVYVDLPADSGLSAGMYVSGEFSIGSSLALSLPESAVVMRDGNQYLMRVGANGVVSELKIRTGRRHAQAIEVLDSLEPAGRFVRAGAAFLRDGDRVHIATPAAAAP